MTFPLEIRDRGAWIEAACSGGHEVIVIRADEWTDVDAIRLRDHLRALIEHASNCPANPGAQLAAALEAERLRPIPPAR